MSWLFPKRAAPVRAVEATPAQLVATGARAGAFDPNDRDGPWRPVGSGGRPVPHWTLERTREFSVAGYRMNPMAKAIIDTYTAFCVGDSGVTVEVTNPLVDEVAQRFWSDPRNKLGARQELYLRSELLNGESLNEMVTGPSTGVVLMKPHDPSIVVNVIDHYGCALWPAEVRYGLPGQEEAGFTVVSVDDLTDLRTGEAMWSTPFRALVTDQRSMPFLSSVVDWLDQYDGLLSNLMDRTALARYMMWDVTVEGGQTEVDAFIRQRGGTHVPKSGSVEVHNQSVTWKPQQPTTGAYEDANAAKSILTLVAGGSGLAKTWLADPEDSNRATSLTMAEPVRRRVKGVQGVWLDEQAELVRYAVDRAVAAGRLPAMVDSIDSKTLLRKKVKASETVHVRGPEIAAADAQLNAAVLLNLSTALEKLVDIGALTPEAAAVAARKGWEDYMGVPWRPDLAKSTTDPNKIADHIDDPKSGPKKPSLLSAV